MEDKIMKAGEMVLNNGFANREVRTVASVLGIDGDAELEFIGTRSRWTGTGYKNYLYRVVGTDDMVVVLHNNGPVDNIEWKFNS